MRKGHGPQNVQFVGLLVCWSIGMYLRGLLVCWSIGMYLRASARRAPPPRFQTPTDPSDNVKKKY